MSALPHPTGLVADLGDRSRSVVWALLAAVVAFAAFAAVIGAAGWAGLTWVASGTPLR